MSNAFVCGVIVSVCNINERICCHCTFALQIQLRKGGFIAFYSIDNAFELCGPCIDLSTLLWSFKQKNVRFIDI